MKVAVFEQWEEAWNKNDAVAWIALLHEHYQFKFHSNGKVMKKSDMTLEMMTAAMRNESVTCLLYTSPSPRDLSTSRMPSSA